MGLLTWTTVTGAVSGNSKIIGGFRWKVISQDIINNRSVLRVEAYGEVNASSTTYNLYDKTSYYKVDGSQQNYTSRFDFRTASVGTKYYVDGASSIFPKGDYKDYTINHNADGTKSVSFNMLVNMDGTSASAGLAFASNQTIVLPTIPRTSKINVPVAGFSYNIGDDLAVDITKYSTSLTDTLTITVGGTLIKTIVGFTSDTIEFDSSEIEDMYDATPNSNTATMVLEVTTKYGATTIGTDDVSGTAHVTNSNPVFTTFTYADQDATVVALTGSNQIIVKGYSDVRGIITTANKATAQNGATMASYRMVIGAKTITASYSAVATVNLDITNIGASLIKIYAIDSRGNETLAQLTPTTYVSYASPIITEQTVSRQNSVDEETDLYVSGTWWNDNFGTDDNTLVATYRYKTTDSSSWTAGATTLTVTPTANTFEIDQQIVGDTASGFDQDYSYDIEVTVTDELTSYIYEVELPKSTPQFHIGSGGACVNGIYDDTLDDGLQVNGTLYSDKLVLPENIYLSAGGAIDLQNSDIIGANALWMNDEANSSGEGIGFLKEGADTKSLDSADYEVLRGYRGKVYYDGNVIGNIDNQATDAFSLTNASSASILTYVQGNLLYVTGTITINTAIGDATVTLVRIDLADLGISAVDFVHAVPMFCDGRGAFVMAVMQADGDIETRDTSVSLVSGDALYFTLVAHISSFV